MTIPLSAEAPPNMVSGAAGNGTSPATQLAERASRLRTRAGVLPYDRWLLIVGGILLPLGLLVIIVGWIGASHTVLLFEQIPYLLSGGLLGLGLVFAGGFIYFAYWQTLLVRETRQHNDVLIASLGRIEALLQAGSATALAAAPAAGAVPDVFVATPAGTVLHRPDCPVVVGRDDVRSIPADTPGFDRCKICA